MDVVEEVHLPYLRLVLVSPVDVVEEVLLPYHQQAPAQLADEVEEAEAEEAPVVEEVVQEEAEHLSLPLQQRLVACPSHLPLGPSVARDQATGLLVFPSM